MLCHENSSHRIFVLKVIFIALFGWFGVKLLKNDGVQIFWPLNLHSGAHLPQDPLPDCPYTYLR